MNFGKTLKHRLESLNINQRELADRIDASKGTISQWISGKSYPDKTLRKALIREGIFTEAELENTNNIDNSRFLKLLSNIPYDKYEYNYDVSTKEKAYEFLDQLFINDYLEFSKFRKTEITNEDLNFLLLENLEDESAFKYFSSLMDYELEQRRIFGKFGIFSKLISDYYKSCSCPSTFSGKVDYEILKENQLMNFINNCLYYNYIDDDFLKYYENKRKISFFKTYLIDDKKYNIRQYICMVESELKHIKNKESYHDIKALELANEMGLLNITENCNKAKLSINKILEGYYELSKINNCEITDLVPEYLQDSVLNLYYSDIYSINNSLNSNICNSCIKLSKKGESFLKVIETINPNTL